MARGRRERGARAAWLDARSGGRDRQSPPATTAETVQDADGTVVLMPQTASPQADGHPAEHRVTATDGQGGHRARG
jgi:hypothetical protein